MEWLGFSRRLSYWWCHEKISCKRY